MPGRIPLLLSLIVTAVVPHAFATTSAVPLPAPEIFAPGVISGPGGDGAPTFSPDGSTLFFTRSAAHWTVIMESHKTGSTWSKPTLSTFSGVWPDSSPAMSPDGSYIIFQSFRPASEAKPGEPAPPKVSNLWRVDRAGDGWGKPVRLPDTVNIGHSIWKPSIAQDGSIYFTFISDKGAKRLYSAQYHDGKYLPAQPVSFSDGTTADVDPEIAPDGSFLVFCSSGRLKDDDKDHLYISRKQGSDWGPVTQIRYAGDDKPYGYSTDDEPRLGADHRTLYFSSDRAATVHFPRMPEQAKQDVDRMELWDNGNTNVWSISLLPWLS